jgi:hypothetical protein
MKTPRVLRGAINGRTGRGRGRIRDAPASPFLGSEFMSRRKVERRLRPYENNYTSVNCEYAGHRV